MTRVGDERLEARVLALLQAGEGDRAATEVLEAFGPAILRYLRSVLRDEEDANDAFSQWAENVWHGLPGFRFASALKTWCYRLACNTARNLRQEAWRRHGQRLVSGQASRLAASIRSRSAVRHEQEQRALDALRAALDDEDRCLLVLRLDQALSWAEVAEVLAAEGRPASPTALMKRYERVKARLGRLARERGLLEA